MIFEGQGEGGGGGGGGAANKETADKGGGGGWSPGDLHSYPEVIVTVAIKQRPVLSRLLLLHTLPPFCAILLLIRCVLTRTKILQKTLLALNGICPGLLLSELQQAQDAFEGHVAHGQQDQHLQQWQPQAGRSTSSLSKKCNSSCRLAGRQSCWLRSCTVVEGVVTVYAVHVTHSCPYT